MNRTPADEPRLSDERTTDTVLIASDRDPLVGRVVGDFLIEEPLGHGGMGTVYRGRQLSLGRAVALKFLRRGPGIDTRAVARFEAEARLAAGLNHPNVVGIYSLGTCDGLPFIAMELVPGRNIGQILADRVEAGLGPPSISECLGIMRQSAQGLQAAAELGLVHRDIKPENLMITPKGVVKVADFGLARDLREKGSTLTETGYTFGTPMYMSPEQVLGRPTDKRSDIYSLGMTFHHILTGRPPLTAESPFLMGLKQVNEKPADVRESRPDCPQEIAELIARMIEKRVEDRPLDVEEVLSVLVRHDTGTVLSEVLATPVMNQAERFSERHAADTIPFGSSKSPQIAPMSNNEIPAGPIVSRRFWLIWLCVTAAGFATSATFGRFSRRQQDTAPFDSGPVWPPGLGLADWTRIERRGSAEKQYRYAQIQAEETDELAAWLAVPGYYPDDTDWAWRAYAQMAMNLVRSSDRLRLTLLQAGLSRCGKGVAFDNMAEIVQAAVDGMDGNEIGMLETLHSHVKEAMDPALAELILAILTRYRQRAGADAIVPTRLTRLQAQVQDVLRIDPKIWPGNFPVNPPSR